jgi:protein TonB
MMLTQAGLTKLWVVVLSVLLHVVIAWAVFDGSDLDVRSAQGAGEGGVEVGLGQLGVYQKMKQQLSAAQQADRPEPVAQVVQNHKATVARPAEASTVPAVKKSAPEPHKEVTKVRPHLLKQTNHNQRNNLPVQPETHTKPTAEHMPAITEKPVNFDSQQPQAADDRHGVGGPEASKANQQQATGQRNDRTSGGNKGQGHRYFGALKSWLNSHKTYPPELKKAKIQGVVTVRFTINQQGQLQQASIKVSSGNARLDQAALAMVQQASPMPAIPDSLKRDRLTLALPVEYSLIDE